METVDSSTTTEEGESQIQNAQKRIVDKLSAQNKALCDQNKELEKKLKKYGSEDAKNVAMENKVLREKLAFMETYLVLPEDHLVAAEDIQPIPEGNGTSNLEGLAVLREKESEVEDLREEKRRLESENEELREAKAKQKQELESYRKKFEEFRDGMIQVSTPTKRGEREKKLQEELNRERELNATLKNTVSQLECDRDLLIEDKERHLSVIETFRKAELFSELPNSVAKKPDAQKKLRLLVQEQKELRNAAESFRRCTLKDFDKLRRSLSTYSPDSVRPGGPTRRGREEMESDMELSLAKASIRQLEELYRVLDLNRCACSRTEIADTRKRNLMETVAQLKEENELLKKKEAHLADKKWKKILEAKKPEDFKRALELCSFYKSEMDKVQKELMRVRYDHARVVTANVNRLNILEQKILKNR